MTSCFSHMIRNSSIMNLFFKLFKHRFSRSLKIAHFQGHFTTWILGHFEEPGRHYTSWYNEERWIMAISMGFSQLSGRPGAIVFHIHGIHASLWKPWNSTRFEVFTWTWRCFALRWWTLWWPRKRILMNPGCGLVKTLVLCAWDVCRVRVNPLISGFVSEISRVHPLT